jgi:hypothetical protein
MMTTAPATRATLPSRATKRRNPDVASSNRTTRAKRATNRTAELLATPGVT